MPAPTTPADYPKSVEGGREFARSRAATTPDPFSVFAPAGDPQPDNQWNAAGRRAAGFTNYAPAGWMGKA